MSSDAEKQPVSTSRAWVLVFGIYLILLNLLLVYLLFRLWPGQVPLKSEHLVVRLVPGILEVDLWTETRFVVLVALAGALGSYIHLATSFTDFVGNRRFYESWRWWYVLRPFMGSALALIVYFAARGGLIAGDTGADHLSPYGVAALAGLTGMFSKQAIDKLREVFENLFKTEKPPPRQSPLAPASGPNDQRNS